MVYSNDFINRVLEATDIVDLISQHVHFKKSGSNLVGLCPFPDHREKTASFSVSEVKQVYHCFGCKRGGNAITFMKDYRAMGFPQAIEYLADLAGIAMPQEEHSGIQKNRDERKKLFHINEMASKFFQSKLRKCPLDVKSYIARRGLEPQTIKAFQLGYAVDDWSALKNDLKSKEVDLQLAAQLGLIRRRSKGSGYFDIFRHRLMFPIIDTSGRVLGFGGRVLNKEHQPKYLNSPETSIFRKGNIFYGLNETAKFIRAKDSVIVVEGYMDLLALYQGGFKNAVATLGTALTELHARRLAQLTKNVTVLFDGDNAGIIAALKSLNILLKQDLLVKGVRLPDGKDPDDLLSLGKGKAGDKNEGGELLKNLLEKAPDLFEMALDHSMRGFRRTSSEQMRVLSELQETLITMKNPLLRDLYVKRLAERIFVSEDWVRKGLHRFSGVSSFQRQQTSSRNRDIKNKVGSPTSNEQQVHGATDSLGPSGTTDNQISYKIADAHKNEIFLLNLALSREAYLQMIKDVDIVKDLASGELKRVFEEIFRVYGQGLESFDRLTPLIASKVDKSSLVTQHLQFGNWDEGDVQACVKKIREANLRSKADQLVSELKTSPNFSSEKLEQIMNIQKKRRRSNQFNKTHSED